MNIHQTQFNKYPRKENMSALSARDDSFTGDSGFTLVEMIMAVMIMAVVFTGSFTCLGQGFSIIENARDTPEVIASPSERTRGLQKP